ncbi:heme-binding protein [Streptomyces sp. PSKA54]|uniref:Heme-binding protein n=1 Tax=Streptomyces himalayensis subsp. aureolus TaxID=2758039 RepID=A0A7W2HKD2_9ACTN|nr:heme-binding protein [Streptomyces himalayensis]MBA4867060.1 heme-binding protein [Streptomyces himalayensis subsp. aureolus]
MKKTPCKELVAVPDISTEEAQRVLSAGVRRAAEMALPVNIAVFDTGANLKTFVRMDGALLGSADIAMGKARTSALFQLDSEALFEYCKPGGTSFGLENSNGGLVVFAGGKPIRNAEGVVVGAVGVSGGSVAQDAEIAQAAAAALAAASA